jgi:hypothetical protein
MSSFIVDLPPLPREFVAEMRALRDAGDEATLDRRIREWVREHVRGRAA